jgi:hypothetical protein
MSKLGCQCGNIISDNTDFIPYKARFIRDQDSTVLDKTIEDICSLREAYKSGQKEEWVKNRFGKNVDSDLRNDWLIMKTQLDNELNVEGTIYQCEKCGRIKIETPVVNHYASFVPEEENWKNILNGIKTKHDSK